MKKIQRPECFSEQWGRPMRRRWKATEINCGRDVILDGPRPIMKHAIYWAAGAEEFRAAADWPLPDSEPLRLYPASNGPDADTHRLDRAPGEGTNRWAAVPFGAIVTPGFDEVANQILSFDLPIETEIELTGPVTLSLSFSSNEIDSHVIARTGRVARDGTHEILSMGSIRPACRRIDAARSTTTEIAIDIDTPEPLKPGVPVTLRFSLTPQPVVLKPGERLRLDVGSRTDLLRSDVEPRPRAVRHAGSALLFPEHAALRAGQLSGGQGREFKRQEVGAMNVSFLHSSGADAPITIPARLSSLLGPKPTRRRLRGRWRRSGPGFR